MGTRCRAVSDRWGHGVGLCQIGALGMALDGRKTKEILLHYYQSSQMMNIYD